MTIALIRNILAADTKPESLRQLWGWRKTDAEFLREALLRAARDADAVVGESDEYGDRFTVVFEMGRESRRAVVRSAWIVLRDETVPRLTSRFVL